MGAMTNARVAELPIGIAYDVFSRSCRFMNTVIVSDTPSL
jgi:hypothetical protein